MNTINSFEGAIDFAQEHITSNGFAVADEDLSRPWGGFFRLENTDAEKFAGIYFPDVEFKTHEGLSPKFLLVKPNEQLSWQYHDRRNELWKVLHGPVGVKLSENDAQPEDTTELKEGDSINFNANIRHRLIGLAGIYGVVAEIWQHTDPNNPSNEDDIVRVEDDYGR